MRRKLRDDRTLRPRLEPVQRVGRDELLLTRPEDHLVPDRERAPVRLRRPAGGPRRRLALEVEVHQSPTAAERLLLAWRTVERRMAMLGARLAGEHHDLLGADTLRIDVHDDLQTRLLEL